MRQAILVEPKHIEFKEVAEPKAADLTAHQVLVNIKRIGICGSEIHSYHGLHPATFYPVVQGHEYSGVVMAVGSEVTVCKPGDHITARPQLVCGKCNPCKRGQYNVCEHLRVQAFQADGAAQDFFVVDDDRVAKLPEGMSLDYGAMIEPSAVGAHASNRTDVKGKNVVVSGAGTIGNLIAQTLKAKLTEKGVTNIPHFGPLFHFDILKTYGYDMDEIAKTYGIDTVVKLPIDPAVAAACDEGSVERMDFTNIEPLTAIIEKL